MKVHVDSICQHGMEKYVPAVGINACNLQKWKIVVRKNQKWIYSWMTPGYIEDEDEYNTSKQLLEKFVCSIPVLGIVDGNTAIF